MRLPNLALFAISAVPLSVLASPVAQFSPPAEDSLTTTTEEQWFPMPTMTPIEVPPTTDTGFMTIQTSMPDGETTDTGFMTIQTSMPAEVTTSNDGMFTIQTSTPNATPTTTAYECEATDVDEESEDDDDEWCEDDEDEDEDPSTSATESPTAISYPTATPLPSTLAPGIYQISPVGPLLPVCLQIQEGQEPADGTPVVLAPCDGSPEQDWEVAPAQWYPPAGNLYIKLAGTNFCLDASFPLGNGTPLKIWTCYDGLVQQRWNYSDAAQLYLVDQGEFSKLAIDIFGPSAKISSFSLRIGQCLDVTDGIIATGTVVQTWECDPGNGNQHWFVTPKVQ